MTSLFGQPITKAALSRRVGDMSQLAGARASELTSGRARGVQAVDVRTGSGLEFTVLPGRALDIAWASFKGTPISYISKTGVVAAAYFEEKGLSGFLRNFFVGMLTTGGFSNIGVPSETAEGSFGLHGRISNTPAEDVAVSQRWEDDDYVIRVSGTVRQAQVFGECLFMHREISTRLGSNVLRISDTVENAGNRPEPLTVLYHCNFGYPIVDATSRLYTSGGNVTPRDDDAAGGMARYDRFEEPTPGYAEQCFYHRLEPKGGRAFAALYNEALDIGAFVRYHTENLPQFIEWKMMGEKEYVVGLEPASNRLDGRAALTERGELRLLASGEQRSFEVEIGVLDGRSNLDALMGQAS